MAGLRLIGAAKSPQTCITQKWTMQSSVSSTIVTSGSVIQNFSQTSP